MADTAASVLGTPVATVDAPPSTAMIPLQDPGTNMNVDTTAAPPVATVNAQPTDTIQPTAAPTYQDPEISTASIHHNWLSRIIDTVGSILGGDQTIAITKSPDGTVRVDHNPSTSGEKWSRIASAALGGAARGMAVGQGPGGAARAFSAGTLAGLQQPQQALAAANEQAKNMNAQQLAIANTALTHQKLVSQMLDSRAKGLTLGADEANLLQATADAIQSSPNTKDLGTFTDMQGIMRTLQSNPDAMSGLTNQALKVIPVADEKGNVQLHAYLTDRADDNRLNDKEERSLYVDVDPKTGEPTLKSDPIRAQSQPKVQIRQAQQTVIAKYLDMHDKWRTAESTANKKETEPPPKTAQEALIAAGQETDPVKKQALLDSAAQIQKNELALRVAGREPTAGGAAALGGASGPEALAALPAGDAATVKAIGEGRQAPPSRFTKEGQRIMGMVNQVYPDYDSTQFPTYQKMRNFMTSGQGGVGLNFIGAARTHLGELERTIPDNVTVPLIGSAINWAKNTATRSTSPELRAFESARGAVSSEVAKAYKGGALSLEEHDQMMNLINESDSPGALRGSVGEFRRLLTGKLNQYKEQWNSGMPNGAVSPNSALERLLADDGGAGGGGAAPPAATTPAAPAAPAAPTGLVTVQIPGQQPGHIPRSALAQFQRDNPNAKVF